MNEAARALGKRLSALPDKPRFVVFLSLAVVLSLGTEAWAQGRQTGILRGSVQDETGGVLPGVTVTTASNALQGTRITVTDFNGDYEILGLPNGEFVVQFVLDGFATVENTVATDVTMRSPRCRSSRSRSLPSPRRRFATVENTVAVPLGGTVATDVTMPLATVQVFQVEVFAVAPTPLASTEISQNMTNEEVGILPMGRTPFEIAELAPGLTGNTVNDGQVTIGGSFAYDNVFLIDGVDINDNLFGYSNDLFRLFVDLSTRI